jgi:hypothetical protein
MLEANCRVESPEVRCEVESPEVKHEVGTPEAKSEVDMPEAQTYIPRSKKTDINEQNIPCLCQGMSLGTIHAVCILVTLSISLLPLHSPIASCDRLDSQWSSYLPIRMFVQHCSTALWLGSIAT